MKLYCIYCKKTYYVHHMVCPFCNNQETSVVDSRKNGDGSIVRRRRNCEQCDKRFTTYENAVIQLIVQKKNKETQDFDYEKLLIGIKNSCVDTGIKEEEVTALAEDITTLLHSKGAVVTSLEIGELVLQKLKEVNEVAYIRFASVYKEFSEVSDFEKEAAKLD